MRGTRRFLPGRLKGAVVELTENGVDFDLWNREEHREERALEPARFVFVGRMVGWKGVDLLLEAWATLKKPSHYRLELIGDGPEHGKLQALRDQLGLASSVEFSGFQTQEECARRLAQADVLILPSLRECGGAVVLEAMASGLPVIATDWGGPAEYLEDSCGILVPVDSRDGFIAGLAEAIERLGADPDLRRRMGQAGRRRVQRYSWDLKVDRILEIYRRASAIGEETGLRGLSFGAPHSRRPLFPCDEGA